MALAITHASVKKDEQKTREQLAQMKNPPEHAWVSGEASQGAWAVGIVVILIAVLLAMPHH
jgi:hypothetical protein